jgi:peptidoglycan hydrolase-like protein with peptidoglycan-binding domain
MFFAGKIACSGIVFLLMTPWISGARPARFDSGNVRSVAMPETDGNGVKGMQQTLQDEKHYGGKVDGVIGLRTRASIRKFQKSENLPVTGQLDLQTAGRLGVEPEVLDLTGSETTQDKPSAGTKRASSSLHSNKTPRKPVPNGPGVVPPA